MSSSSWDVILSSMKSLETIYTLSVIFVFTLALRDDQVRVRTGRTEKKKQRLLIHPTGDGILVQYEIILALVWLR